MVVPVYLQRYTEGGGVSLQRYTEGGGAKIFTEVYRGWWCQYIY